MDCQKRFSVVQTNSMYQVASVYRGLARNEDLELLLDWPGNVRNFSTAIRLPSLEILQNQSCNSPSLPTLVFVKWVSVSCHDFLSIFCTENSSTRNSWALFNSSISCMLLIWVSRRAFSFMTNSSWSRTCCLRDSTCPWWASSNSNRWA